MPNSYNLQKTDLNVIALLEKNIFGKKHEKLELQRYDPLQKIL